MMVKDRCAFSKVQTDMNMSAGFKSTHHMKDVQICSIRPKHILLQFGDTM